VRAAEGAGSMIDRIRLTCPPLALHGLDDSRWRDRRGVFRLTPWRSPSDLVRGRLQPAMLTGLDGKAPPTLVRALVTALDTERDGLERVRRARNSICEILRSVKSEPNVTSFIALAIAITPPIRNGGIAASTARRRRVAHALRCRLWQCQRRAR
jgi:hypothetical protein